MNQRLHVAWCVCGKVGNGEILPIMAYHPLMALISLQTLAMSTSPKPVKKVPIHLQSAANRVYIKNGKLI